IHNWRITTTWRNCMKHCTQMDNGNSVTTSIETCSRTSKRLPSQRAVHRWCASVALAIFAAASSDTARAATVLDTTFAPATINGFVHAVAIPASPGTYSAVLVAGEFTSIGSLTCNRIALLSDTGVVNNYQFSGSADGTIYS